MENSDGKSQEPQSSSCSMEKEGQAAIWGVGVSRRRVAKEQRPAGGIHTHLLAPELPLWLAQSGPVR